MNYRDILSKAWRITLDHKYLWILGFCAGLFLGNDNNNFGATVINGGAWIFQNIDNILNAQGLIAILTLIAALIFWVIGTLARIGLIHEVTAINARYGKPLGHNKALFQVALPHLTSILGMQSILWSPVLGLNLLTVFVFQATAQISTTDFLAGNLPTTNIAIIGLLGCSTVLLAIPLLYIDAFAYRSLIIENLTIKESIQKGIEIVRNRYQDLFGLSIICLILGFIFASVIGLIFSPMLLAIARAMAQDASQCAQENSNIGALTTCMQLNRNPAILFPFLLISLLSAALSSVWIAFQSAAFTLAYHKITKKEK